MKSNTKRYHLGLLLLNSNKTEKKKKAIFEMSIHTQVETEALKTMKYILSCLDSVM